MNGQKDIPQSSHGKSIPVGGILIFLLIAVFLSVIGYYLLTDRDQFLAPGDRPQDFTLISFDGEQVDTAALRGDVVLIHFWASWCTSCEQEAELLEEAWVSLSAQEAGGTAFLGVAYKDDKSDSLEFLSKVGLTFPNGPDSQGAISSIYQVTKIPETYILDTNGVLRVIKIGSFTSVSEILAAVETARSPQER